MLNWQNFIDTMQDDRNRINHLALYIKKLRREIVKLYFFIFLDYCWVIAWWVLFSSNIFLMWCLILLGVVVLRFIHVREERIVIKNSIEIVRLGELLKEEVEKYERKYSVKIL